MRYTKQQSSSRSNSTVCRRCVRICIRMLPVNVWKKNQINKRTNKQQNNRKIFSYQLKIARTTSKRTFDFHKKRNRINFLPHFEIAVILWHFPIIHMSLVICTRRLIGSLSRSIECHKDSMRSCWRSRLKRAVQTTKLHTTISVGPYLRDHAINNRAAFIQFLSVVVHGRVFDRVPDSVFSN